MGKIDAFNRRVVRFDRSIILVSLALLIISIVLISSASVQEAFNSTGDSYFYLKRQIVFCVIGIGCGIVMAAIPSQTWFKFSVPLLFVSFFLLFLVLIIGREVNEATRWISLGPINLQPAELLKLFWIIYFSSYTCRKIEMVRHEIAGFIKPMVFITAIAMFLLLQPDFGSLVVVTAITFGILFVAGAGLLKYIAILGLVGVAGWIIVLIQPYRLARVTSFLDPWKDRFGSGYQLTQSLMAFGRGGVTGEGIGNSVQKLGYLPEAHTDFVMSIWGEEVGFIGVVAVILLEFFLVYKAVILSIKILTRGPTYQGYVAFGIGLFFCLQTVINIGAASGGLPTKGLTLPLVSYGGSSLMVCMAALGILLRIDFEWRNRELIDPLTGLLVTPVRVAKTKEQTQTPPPVQRPNKKQQRNGKNRGAGNSSKHNSAITKRGRTKGRGSRMQSRGSIQGGAGSLLKFGGLGRALSNGLNSLADLWQRRPRVLEGIKERFRR